MIFKARWMKPSIRSFALWMKDSLDRYRVEKIGARAVVPTPDNLKELAVGFIHSGGWLR